MRAEDFITEIDYTPGIEPLQISFDQLLSNATVIGDMDNRDVWKYDDGNTQVYFTRSDSIDGLIIMQGDKLHGIKNYSSVKGLITMLVGFVVHRLKIKVVIEPEEPFTSNGINWLCSLLRAGGRGLTIVDQKGNSPDPDALYTEWATVMKGTVHGPTGLTIESKMQRILNTKQQNMSEGRLMPANWFIGSDTQ